MGEHHDAARLPLERFRQESAGLSDAFEELLPRLPFLRGAPAGGEARDDAPAEAKVLRIPRPGFVVRKPRERAD